MAISSQVSRRFWAARRLGFTLVELLVVITIIGMLVALLIPAVQSARETARSTQCSSRLGELAKATMEYQVSKSSFPAYAQFVKRGQQKWATITYDSSTRHIRVVPSGQREVPFSWAAMLLRNIERQDIWDQIVSSDDDVNPEIRPIETFTCPSDQDAVAIADLPALSYNANTGAWDRDNRRKFLTPPNKGDTTDNGVMLNQAAYELASAKAPVNRLSGIKDGANMTIMYSENNNKTYEPQSPGQPPLFTWLSNSNPSDTESVGTEQQFGLVWVANTSPQPGSDLTSQEGLNRNANDVVDFDPTSPRFARPASNHNSGVNVAFCDAHVMFMRDDIDYTVYQRLMTTNGAKCVDPVDWSATGSGTPIYRFRTAAPLSEQDYN